MIEKAVVLLSAGLDSSVNFLAAVREYQVVMALTFDYGQRAAKKEIEKSKILADAKKIPHQVIEIPWLKNLGSSGLTNPDKVIPSGTQISIDSQSISEKSAKAVWVPNRNGVFLNIAASFAESLGAKYIIPGFNAEEAFTFPDNSYDFLRATRQSLSFSTANQVEINCYTIKMTKPEIAKLGLDLQLPFKDIWPCYLDFENWCGQCESCQRAKRAFQVAHVDALSFFMK